jgi:peptidoglycan-associated lipoprotein
MRLRNAVSVFCILAFTALVVHAQEGSPRWLWSPGLGLYLSPINQALASDLKLGDTKGLLVLAVVQGSASYQAGVKPGDILARLSSQELFSEDGKEGTADLIRDGSLLTVNLRTRKLPNDASITLARFPATPRRPATYFVDPGGGANFRTIIGALLQTVPGDKIVLKAGDYVEAPLIPLGISIQAAEKLVVRVSSEIPWLLMSGNGVNLSGISFSRAGLVIEDGENVAVSDSEFSVPDKHTGLVIKHSKGVSVIRCTFRGTAETVGTSAYDAQVLVSDSLFVGHGKAAIVIGDDSKAKVQNSLMDGNANGVFAKDSEVTFTKNIVTGTWDPSNTDKSTDFGIRLENCKASLSKNSVRRHRFGIALLDAPVPAIIANNTLTQDQNGVALISSPATLTGNLVIQNEGNGIEVQLRENESQIVRQQVRILRNTLSDNEGYGILVNGYPRVFVRENLIEANDTGVRLEKSGGTIENNTVVLQRYAGLFVGKDSDVEVYNNILASNSVGLSLDAISRHKLGSNDIYGNLLSREFPLRDGNYLRVDHYTTRDSQKVGLGVYPAYDIKAESDLSVDPGFVSAGNDYRLRQDSKLVAVRGKENRYVGAYAPPGVAPARWPDESFETEIQDAFFDYDQSDLRPDAEQAVQKAADFLRVHPELRLSIEGHCDERGSTDYNLALGDLRAEAAKNRLAALGVSTDRIETLSMGKERPFCTEEREECWQQNRRVHFAAIR